MSTFAAAVAGALCLLIFGLPVPLVSTIIGINSADNPCQSMDSIGLSLSDWLMGSGIAGLILVLSIATFIILAVCLEEGSAAVIITLVVFNSIFALIYTIIGAVVLFRSNMDCLRDGTDLGVMSLIVLIFYWLSLCSSCCTARMKKDD